jgi:hypothetical protein
MPSEKRTRVEDFLPVRTDFPAYRAVTDWLAEELAYARGGATLTTPFTGLYMSTATTDVIRDTIIVLFADFNLDLDTPEHTDELIDYLDGLRRLLMDALEEEEVWIVYHSIKRIVGASN